MYINSIPVSDDFHDGVNKFSNGGVDRIPDDKRKSTFHKFLTFISKLITTGWIVHNEIRVMDNARIYIGGDAAMVK
jgi:hypothetical protein